MANDVAVTFPVLTLSARATKQAECLVMNTKNFAVSEYANYGFNSMTKFNGLNLIADQNGIYEQDDSDLDAGLYNIPALIKTGVIDIYSTQINRLRDSYLMYRSDGDVRLTTKADKKATRTYLVLESVSDSNVVKKRRIKFERGIRNRHFDFKLENVNGSTFEIDMLSIEIEPVISKRR